MLSLRYIIFDIITPVTDSLNIFYQVTKGFGQFGKILQNNFPSTDCSTNWFLTNWAITQSWYCLIYQGLQTLFHDFWFFLVLVVFVVLVVLVVCGFGGLWFSSLLISNWLQRISYIFLLWGWAWHKI